MAPTLETERLIISPLRQDLFEQHFNTMSDLRVTAFIGGGQPQSRTEAWRRFCQGAGLWSLLGYGYWAILDRPTGRMIGMGGLAHFERTIAELNDFPEVGYALNADWWGRGLTTEFLAAAVGWADANVRATETRCIIAPDNAPSIRVAEKNGYIRMHEVENELGVSILFRRPAPSQD
jgi:RimJ/RimL family protein N-acetyltransferase